MVFDDNHAQYNRGYYLKLDMRHPVNTYLFNYGGGFILGKFKK